MKYLSENAISKIIVESALKVHEALGPGLLESSYETCLCYELLQQDLLVEKQKPMKLAYEGVDLDMGYRIDILVNKKVIIEIKSVDQINPIHRAQLLTYLKLSGCKLGLLLNFNVLRIKDGIKRLVNNL